MIFERYVFNSLLVACLVTAATLTGVIFLTQSLRFLELVINSGASGLSFWILTMLALPRFFEMILPIALVAAVIFVYNRLTMDSELIAIRAAGFSPMRLARPALKLSFCMMVFLLFVTMWLAPVSLSAMHQMRQVIKAQYSTLLLSKGVFNTIGKDVTVYVQDREKGELQGLMIYDSRSELKQPVTIIARRGQVVATDEGQQVVVFDGSRQEFNRKTGALSRLDFERYSVDLPESGPVRQRWREPEERTYAELLHPNPKIERDVQNVREFRLEAHRRLISPLLAPAFAAVALAFLLLGTLERRGQGWRIAGAVGIVVALEGLYLIMFNLAANSVWALTMMYLIALLPLAGGLYILSPYSEDFRAKVQQRA